MCRVFITTVMFHKKQWKSMSKILSGSTSIFQTETHSLVETEHNNKVQRRQQQSYSRMLCFTEEISTSTRPRLQQKHINRQTYRGIKCIFDSSDDEDTTRVNLDIEKVSFVEKLRTYFCQAFLPFCSGYS